MVLFFRFSLKRMIPLAGILVFCIAGAFGETKPDLPGFDSGAFDYHFRRADREISPERWMAEARQGILMARNAWELTATELYGDRVLLAEAGRTIETWSEEELEKRFTEWLLRRFFGAGLTEQMAGTTQEIREANLSLVYHLDENGKIRYDEETGDPLVIRPGEAGAYMEGDQAQWRKNAEEIIRAGTARYEAQLTSLFPELLAYVPEENRDTFEEKLRDVTVKAIAGRQKEFEALAAREERLFVAQRTGDVWSLRKKSEAETAAMITAQLIEETETLCVQGIAALETRIEAAESGSGDLALAGSEWLAAYREQFARGLKAWADAEERFFIRRIEWEQEAGQYYLDGEEAWSNAFSQFEQERQRWEAKARTLFASGEAVFKRASENLEAAIAGARAEFEQDLLLRSEAGVERARAWVDTYITCGSVVASARENITFWLRQYGKTNAPTLAGGGFSAWISAELRSHWQRVLASYEEQYGTGGRLSLLIRDIIAGWATASQEEDAVTQLEQRGIKFSASFKTARELKNWSTLYDSYIDKAKAARDALINDFNMVMGSGSLKDILAEGAVSEDFNLDEYQIELIRAKAVAGYWEKRRAIAQAVVSYAEELTAGRMTDSEGIAAWEQAKQSYDQALGRYETALSRLSAAGTGVQDAQAALNSAAAALREAENTLEEKNQAYAILMSAYVSGRSDFILKELVTKYEELLRKYKFLSAEGEGAAYVRYLERAYELGFAQELEAAGQMVKQLVLGGEETGASLAALTNRAANIMVFEEHQIIPEHIEKFGLEADDPFYALIQELLSEKAEKLAGAEDQQAVQEQYHKLISAMTKTAKAQAQAQMEIRLKTLGLFAAASTADWYFSARGHEPDAEDRARFAKRGLEAALTHDVEEDARALLRARLALELEGLSCFLGEAGGGDRARLLSGFCSVTAEDAAKIFEALKELRLVLDSAGDSSFADYYAALENAAQSEELVAWFVNGGSCFGTPSGRPIAYGLLEAELTAAARSQGLLAAYEAAGREAAPVLREAGLQGLRGLEKLFTSYGITLSGGELPGMKSVGTALLGKAGSVTHNLSAFLSLMNAQLDPLPQWVKTEVQAWQSSLITYIAAKTIYNNKSIPGSGAAIKNEIEALAAQSQAAQLVTEALSYAEPGSARFLSAALRLPPELFTAITKTAIEEEAVRRIGRDLAKQYGDETLEDEATLREALTAAGSAHHGYAEEGIRKKSVDEAIRLLRSGQLDGGIQAVDYYYETIARELPLIFNTLSGRQETLSFEYALIQAYEDITQSIKAAEGEGRSHWRQYISAGFLGEYNNQDGNEAVSPGVSGDPEGTYDGIKAAKNWREGMLADAFEKVSQDAQRLNAAFRAFRNAGEAPEYEFIKAGIKKYQDDPLLEWDEALIKTVDYVFYDNYNMESGEFQKNFIHEALLEKEIERLGKGYAASKQNSAKIKTDIQKISDEIVGLQDAYDRAAAQYGKAASDFAGAGAAYDAVYKAVKKDYADLEEARTAYETQDAIRRWASTAYLDNTPGTGEITADYKNPYEDLAYSKSRHERAAIALAALTGLYAAEERRPYADKEYEAAYTTYKESFQRMLLSMKTLGVLEGAIAEEMRTNSAYYDTYNQYLNELGYPISYSPNYQPPDDKSLWQVMDMIQIKNGKLAFSHDGSLRIQKMSGGQAAALKQFFTPQETAGVEVNMVSAFEAALRQLNQNMSRYEVSTNAAKYAQWGLARDYLLQQLMGNNTDIGTMAGWYSFAKALNEGENLGEMAISVAALSKDTAVYQSAMYYRRVDLRLMQKNSWDQLSDEEKADLEFYTILTLLGGGGGDSKGFSAVSAQFEYAHIDRVLNSSISQTKKFTRIPLVRHLYRAGLARLNTTRNHLLPTYHQIIETVEKARTGLEATTESLHTSLELYLNSCNRLARLNGTGTGNGTIGWNSIERAIKTAGGITADEIQRLKKYWDQMEEDTSGSYRDTVTALKELIRWSKNKKEDDKRNFEQAWIGDEQVRAKNEASYREVFAAFVEGKADIHALNKAAAAAYGNKAPARKNHLENLEQTIVQDLKGVTENGADYRTEYRGLADELTELIKRGYMARYNAELTARELEWDMQRYDIKEKYQAWLDASALILERGRTDWKAGITKIQASYAGWAKRFNEEYQAIDEAWIAAYLAGLDDKARWVTMATEAANSAAAGALLALVGSEAEMMGRSMDTRILSGMTLSSGAEEAENTLGQLLQAAGIMNMETAFAAAKGMTGTISSQVRRGMGGLTFWDTGTVQAAAAALAKEANEELAARETKRVAAAVQLAVKEVLEGLNENVAEANEAFDESMDDVFIIEGQWRKNGRYYTKEAVVHSTLVDPVITETATAEAYEFYKMAPINLSTDLSEERIKELDALAVQALIDNMYAEVQGIAEEIFGAGEDDSGLFARHIGEGPTVKPNANADMDINEVFSDDGTGQLGKLLRLYIYWAIKERNGINAMNSALWEKPIWDSRDSKFQAPSIRSVVDVGNQVVSAVVSTVVGAVAGAFSGGAGFALGVALNTAMNLSDDLVFGAMDVTGGFKTWDEAGVEFGKKAVITGAGALIGGVFNGVGAAASAASSTFLQSGISGMVTQNLTGLSKLAAQTALAGVQSVATGTVTSALSAVTYNTQDGFGFSRDIFTSGMKGASIGALSGMTGSLTTGMMNWGLEGFYGQIHTDGAKLSSLAGGLAGEGVNYAFTGDYALNLFNLDLLSAGKVDSGLLELHLGRGGLTMGFGTGGVDVSAGTMTSALRGLEAWKVNAQMLLSDEENARQYASQLRTLYSGDAAAQAEFEAALEGMTRYVENRYAEGTESFYDEDTGIKTVLLGRDALEDGSQFGLNVVFSHEAYRNGRDDGLYGQIVERNTAVAGHIAAALGLAETYGTDSLSASLWEEALWYQYALDQGEYSLVEAALGAYDTGRDFWQLTGTGGLKYDGSGYLRDVDGLYINYDGTKTEAPDTDDPKTGKRGKTIGASGIETGLLRILALEPTEEHIIAVQNMMVRSGLQHTVDPTDPENRDLWMWKGTTAIAIANDGREISNNLLRRFGMFHLPESMFLRSGDVSKAYAIKDTANEMSRKEAYQPNVNGETYCNFVFLDTAEAVFGENDLTKALRDAGLANKIGLFLDENYPRLDSGLIAQAAANMGHLVAASYINPGYLATGDNNAYHGHIGTVVANYGTYIPALGPRISQGGLKNGEYWTYDPNTFGLVINNTSYYALKAGRAKK